MDDYRFDLALGGLAIAAAFAAWLGDRRRMRRSDPDAVGCMPWREVSFWAILGACVFLGFGVRSWLAG